MLENVPGIEKPKATQTSVEVMPEPFIHKTDECFCIFYKSELCIAPKLKFEICKTCSRCYLHAVSHAVQVVYKKIVGLAMSLMNRNGGVR